MKDAVPSHPDDDDANANYIGSSIYSWKKIRGWLASFPGVSKNSGNRTKYIYGHKPKLT